MNNEILDLQNELEHLIKTIEHPQKILEVGANEFVKDLLKLTKPKSKIKVSGYTHLVDTFSYNKSKYFKEEIDVCWGKYYGPFVENGTTHGKVKTKSQAHLKPTFNRNKEKYYDKMIKAIGI